MTEILNALGRVLGTDFNAFTTIEWQNLAGLLALLALVTVDSFRRAKQ
jgi:hypothetical protein